MSATIDRPTLFAAIEASWSRATSATPDDWTAGNPALGQCEPTSLVLLAYLGGDLELFQVFVDEELTEHHYRNLIGDDVVDLTASQFTGKETLVPLQRLDHDFVRERFPHIRESILERYEVLADAVAARIGPPAEPLRAAETPPRNPR